MPKTVDTRGGGERLLRVVSFADLVSPFHHTQVDMKPTGL